MKNKTIKRVKINSISHDAEKRDYALILANYLKNPTNQTNIYKIFGSKQNMIAAKKITMNMLADAEKKLSINISMSMLRRAYGN